MPKNMPYLDSTELMVLFRYTNVRAFRRAAREDKLPVPTWKMGGRFYADKEAVRRFFKNQRDAAMARVEGGTPPA
jgi:hypothetical protein